MLDEAWDSLLFGSMDETRLTYPETLQLACLGKLGGISGVGEFFFSFFYFTLLYISLFCLLSFSPFRATYRLWSKHWILLLLVMALARCCQTIIALALLLIISFLRFGTRGARSSLYFVIVPMKQLGIFPLSVFYVAQSTREP